MESGNDYVEQTLVFDIFTINRLSQNIHQISVHKTVDKWIWNRAEMITIKNDNIIHNQFMRHE